MRVRGKPLAAALAAVVCVLAWAAPATAKEPKPLPPPVPAADDALTDALEDGELTEAEYALERARSVFQLGKVRREFGDVERAGTRDATLILRDLAVRLRQVPPAERAQARGLLARPDDGDVPPGTGNGWTAHQPMQGSACGDHVCVHWVDAKNDADAPPDADNDPTTVPPWVVLTLGELENTVWAQEVDAIGYRAPLSDGTSQNNGGNDLLDVYLDDLGDDGLFGYCTTDDPNADVEFTVSAYCVLDNDYSPLQYGTTRPPADFFRVTAAHEFHHAVQFAYDWLEDPWLMEGTATNMEETVYPAINDNIFFLRGFSPLTRPSSPLDRAGSGGSEYGSWIFWRYLEEKVAKGNPAIIRQVWERADASLLGPDDYSLLAVRNVLGNYGTSFPSAFVDFAISNRLRRYKDGAKYPATPTARRHEPGPRGLSTGWRTFRPGHLGNVFVSFTPARRATAKSRLRVSVNLPSSGAEATLLSLFQSGKTVVRRVALNRYRNATVTVPFGRGVVKRLDLVLTNRSTRMTNCWTDDLLPVYSCLGNSPDDGTAYSYRGVFVP
jgi:hypothetical protein